MDNIRLRLMSDVELRGKVRGRDRDTSWDAAGRQTRSKTKAVQDAIVTLLTEHGPMTDEALYLKYATTAMNDESIPWPVTSTSVRTRRHELHVVSLVTDTGRRGRTVTGSTAIVWAVA